MTDSLNQFQKNSSKEGAPTRRKIIPPRDGVAPLKADYQLLGRTTCRNPIFELPFVVPRRENSPYAPTSAVFCDDYELGTFIGQGLTAYVFECKHRVTEHVLAVKCIDKSCLLKGRDALETEVMILACVNHPGCVNLQGLYEDEDYVYLVCDLIKGGELFDRIVKTSPQGYTERHAARIIASVLVTVAYLHENGIAHRDLKPENILFKSTNPLSTTAVVGDFGLAKIWNDGAVLKTACGSPNYVAPEVLARDLKGYTVAADMWSIGVITYVLLCGFPPFHHEDGKMVLQQVLVGQFTFPSPYWDAVSAEARNFISRLLVRDPASRMTAPQALQHQWIQRYAAAQARPSVFTDDVVADDTNEPPLPRISQTLRLFREVLAKTNAARSAGAEHQLLSQKRRYEEEQQAAEAKRLANVEAQKVAKAQAMVVAQHIAMERLRQQSQEPEGLEPRGAAHHHGGPSECCDSPLVSVLPAAPHLTNEASTPPPPPRMRAEPYTVPQRTEFYPAR